MRRRENVFHRRVSVSLSSAKSKAFQLSKILREKERIELAWNGRTRQPI